MAAALALALLLAACSDDSSGESQGAEPDVPEAEPANEPVRRQDQVEPEVQHRTFVSRPDIRPPVIDVMVSKSTASGLLFLTPKNNGAQKGPLMIDNEGQVVFASPQQASVTDFRVQMYEGEPVLTWWQGKSIDGRGDGEYVILDSSYREVARVAPGNGLMGDLHEFQLTDRGTAFMLAYQPEPADLTRYGGPADGFIYDYYVQEVDVETGEVLFQWRASDHVPVSDTYRTLVGGTDGSGSRASPYDWFHVNSVAEDGDDTLLVSARNTNAVYAIDRRTGGIRWRLGGKSSDFRIGDRAEFSLQHDARRQPDGTISIFDNIHPATDESRALFLDVDETTRTATVVRELRHPEGVRASSMGGAQLLSNGGAVVGWGSPGRLSEFSPEGELVFDATIAPANSYRSYRFEWEGRPNRPPDLVVRPGDNGFQLYVSWNGATEVAQWRVLGGAAPTDLAPVTTEAKDGFETQIAVADVDYVAVQALDDSGEVLGTSPVQTAAATTSQG